MRLSPTIPTQRKVPAVIHRLCKLLRRILGPKGAGYCLDCNVPLSVDERRYYHVQCEACVADEMEWMEELR